GGTPVLLKLADVAVVLVIGHQVFRRKDWMSGAAWSTFALLASLAWLVPWYVVWLLPLAALAPDGVLRRHAVMLAFGGMLTYIIEYFAFVNQPDVTRNFFVQFFLVLVAFVPLLVLNHGGTPAAWRLALNRYLGGISSFVADRPRFAQRLMLGLILVVAGLLRLLALGTNGQGTDPLHHISGNLSVAVADARGLEKLFAVLQSLCVLAFGNRPFAVLLPSALIGTATVWLIASLAEELFARIIPERAQIIGLLAALFVATAQWHVALSRSGAQVVLLPCLIAAAALLLWRARRLRLQALQLWAKAVVPPAARNGGARPDGRGAAAPAGKHTSQLAEDAALQAILLRRWPLLALMSICVGLVSILEPTLWPIPVALIVVTISTGWNRRREIYAVSEALLLGGLTALVALPTAWYYLARYVGFPPGSALLARSNPHHSTNVSPLSLDFWGHILGNLWLELGVLVTQNYSAAGAQTGGIPILPALLVPFLVVGLWLTLRGGRTPAALMLAVLAALPFLVGITVVAPSSVIIAATALPIMCILPAIGLEAVAHWFASLPAAMSGPDNTVFISRENLLRVALLLILLIATVSTFFWYFANTIVGPTHIVRPA
ncbi:MAG: hypothetical protein H0X24_16410, partial [Ktedonobacterales bacterium]|nr:hypothetical protein [Ktedonobacterales bacterium]